MKHLFQARLFRHFTFSAVALSATLILVLSPAQAQMVREHGKEKLRGFHDTSVARRIKRSFSSDTEARAELRRILNVVGLAGMTDRLILRATADIPNAAAVFIEKTKKKDRERLILYNAEFMQRIKQKTKNYWSLLFILAHEVGHHVRYHTEAEGRWHEFELEADYFAGFVLRRLGATLDETQQAIRTLSPAKASKTHPGRADRLQMIAVGWTDGGSGAGAPAPRRPSGTPVANNTTQLGIVSQTGRAVSVSVGATDIDDKMEVFVDGKQAGTCTWAPLKPCSISINRSLRGAHTVRFKLTNFVYNGFCLSAPCGRWSANMHIKANGKELWSRSVSNRDNTPGVKFDQTLSCDFTGLTCRPQ